MICRAHQRHLIAVDAKIVFVIGPMANNKTTVIYDEVTEPIIENRDSFRNGAAFVVIQQNFHEKDYFFLESRISLASSKY